MRKSLKKTKLLQKFVELMAPDERITTEGVVQSQPWPTHPKIDAQGTTDRRPGSGRPRSVRTTQSGRRPHPCSVWRPLS